MTLGDRLLLMRKVCSGGKKMSADGTCTLSYENFIWFCQKKKQERSFGIL